MINSPQFQGYTRLGGERTKGQADWREQLDFGVEREIVSQRPGTPAWTRLQGVAAGDGASGGSQNPQIPDTRHLIEQEQPNALQISPDRAALRISLITVHSQESEAPSPAIQIGRGRRELTFRVPYRSAAFVKMATAWILGRAHGEECPLDWPIPYRLCSSFWR